MLNWWRRQRDPEQVDFWNERLSEPLRTRSGTFTPEEFRVRARRALVPGPACYELADGTVGRSEELVAQHFGGLRFENAGWDWLVTGATYLDLERPTLRHAPSWPASGRCLCSEAPAALRHSLARMLALPAAKRRGHIASGMRAFLADYSEASTKEPYGDDPEYWLMPATTVATKCSNDFLAFGLRFWLGSQRGMPDVVVPGQPSRLLEVKAPGDRLRPAQMTFLACAAAHDVRASVIYLDDDNEFEPDYVEHFESRTLNRRLKRESAQADLAALTTIATGLYQAVRWHSTLHVGADPLGEKFGGPVRQARDQEDFIERTLSAIEFAAADEFDRPELTSALTAAADASEELSNERARLRERVADVLSSIVDRQ